MANVKLVVVIASATMVVGSASLGHSPEVPVRKLAGPVVELPASHVLVLEPGQEATAQQVEHAFVVVRRADGSVPRGYLWDEPLGCPDSARP